MAEPEVAAKAPESDALEDSPAAGDTPAQKGPGMGEHCVSDRPTRQSLLGFEDLERSLTYCQLVGPAQQERSGSLAMSM